MIRNYIKIALRNLIRQKVHSFINIVGLSIGLAIVILIGLFVRNEFSVDSFYKNKDRIYRVEILSKMGRLSIVPDPFNVWVKDKFPEIEN